MAYQGNQPAENYASFERQVFTIVNSQTAYTLTHAVTNENDIRLVINSVVQEPGSGKAYTASNTTLTLSAALVNGTDEMYCVYLGRALQTVNPPNASVGNSQTAPTIITGQTAETSIATDDTILIYDTSASALRKMTRANFVSGVGGANTPSFHAYKTATQNVTSNTFTKAEFDVELYDTDGNYASNRFTPQTAGKYFVYANLHLDGSSYPDHLETAIYKNGSMIATSFVGQAGNYIYGNRLVQTTVDMNGSSDYVEVYGKVRQSGSTHFAGGEVRKYFGAYKIIT